MALFEIHFMKVEYIYFLLLFLVDAMFNLDQVHFTFKIQDVPKGITNIISSLASLAVGILYFISEIFSTKKIIIRQNDTKFTHKIKRILLELSPGLVDALANIFYIISLFIPNFEFSFLTVSLDLIVQSVGLIIGIHLCNVIVLKMKTYIHHTLAFIIIIPTIISVTLYYIISISGAVSENWFKLNIYNIIIYCLYIVWLFLTTLRYVLQKYLIQKKFYNIYYTQLMTGIGFFLLIVPILFVSKYNYNCQLFFQMNMGYPELIEIFIYKLIWNVLYIKVINHLNPFYIVLNSLILAIFFIFQNMEFIGKISWVLHFVLLLIGCLIYTESLIINACGLSYNCEINIRKRAEDEQGQLLEDKREMQNKEVDITFEEETIIEHSHTK